MASWIGSNIAFVTENYIPSNMGVGKNAIFLVGGETAERAIISGLKSPSIHRLKFEAV